MSFIILVGSTGKMSLEIQKLFSEKKIEFKLWSEKAPKEKRATSFKGSRGVIDFSLPDATEKVVAEAVKANVPLVSGTTGFTTKTNSLFRSASKKIPIVCDSNFSVGIELLCQATALISQALKEPLGILDLHHDQKRDAPSGTALKISERAKEAGALSTQIQSFRLGKIPGEHRVIVSFQDETIELIHRAHARRPFAEGAYKALLWAQKQKPGLYSMKNILA